MQGFPKGQDATSPENSTPLKANAFADELLGDTSHTESPNSLPSRRVAGCAAEGGELEGPPCAHRIDNASHLVRGLSGRAGDKLQDQASSGADLPGSLSKCHLHVFKEFLPLRLRETNDQPSEARQ